MKLNNLLLFLGLILALGCDDGLNESDKLALTAQAFQLDYVDNIFFTQDDGMLISGTYDGKYTLIKTDKNLNPKWTKNNYDWGNLIFGSGWGSSFYSIQIVKVFQLSDGKYVCFGLINEGGDVVFSSVLIILLSKDGDQIKTVRFDDADASNVLETNDGGYIMFGHLIMKIDRNFNQVWEKNLGDSKYTPCQITPDGDGFALTGTYNRDQVFLRRYDGNGNESWGKIYKHNEYPFEEAGFDVKQLDDDGFLIVGRAGKSLIPNIIECQILRLKANGDTVWTRRFDFPINSWLENIVSYKSNEFVVFGSVGFPNDDYQKSVLMKIDKDGQLMDSLSTVKFKAVIYTPYETYLKVEESDSGIATISVFNPDKLFQ